MYIPTREAVTDQPSSKGISSRWISDERCARCVTERSPGDGFFNQNEQAETAQRVLAGLSEDRGRHFAERIPGRGPIQVSGYSGGFRR